MFRPETFLKAFENHDPAALRTSLDPAPRWFAQGPLLLIMLAAAVMLSLAFSPLPPRAEAADVYSYTDENGVLVITNTPLPEKIKAKAKKIDSYRNITDEERKSWEKEKADQMKAWRDSQAAEDESRRKKTEPAEVEKPESLRRMEAESAEAAKSARDAREKAIEVLKVLP